MRRPRPARDQLAIVHLLPNLVTILGLCAGLTSIRFVFAERYEMAVALLLFAVVIDGLDGLLARQLNAASPFGAELDSLSDFLNFGVAPGLLVYHFALDDMRGQGWIFVLVYAICCCLRLARFNVDRAAPTPAGRVHFVGVPAPAGAMLALLPMFLSFEGLLAVDQAPLAVAVWLGVVGMLMASRVPTFSPRMLRIPRDRARWVLIGAAFVVGVVFTRFWLLLILLDLAYLLGLVWFALVRARAARP